MKKNNPKRMKEKGSKSTKIIIFFLIIVILIGIAILVVRNLDEIQKIFITTTNKEEIEPVIYYNYNNNEKIPLLEEGSVFSGDTTIIWRDECTGIIKKNGKQFSKESGTILVDDGNYEITVSSASGKLKVTKTLTIDKTPPDVEVTKNSSGSYTITFKDINDIGTATLTKLDTKAEKIISETNLLENGLQESIEIKEEGYYILKVTDKLGNVFNKKTKFLIK